MKRFLLAGFLSFSIVGQISCDSSVIQTDDILTNVSKGALNTMTNSAQNGLIGLCFSVAVLAEQPWRFATLCAAATSVYCLVSGLTDISKASNFDESGSHNWARKKAVLRGWYGAGQIFGMFATIYSLDALLKSCRCYR